MGRLGLRPARGLAQTTGEAVVRIVPRAPWRRALAGGALWAGWPCGLLQTALLTAALSATPLGGGLAMAAFALASAPALWLWPWLWRRLGAQASVEVNRWAVRVAGLGLAVGSGFALWHGLWGENGLFC
jgi:sulfite exporter TauE/SafE